MIYNDGYGMIEMAHITVLESYLKNTTKGMVVELGCGNTQLSIKSFWSKRYIAIEKDVSQYPKSECKNVTIINGDAKALPFQNETINLCIALGLFGNLDICSGSQSDIVIDSKTRTVTDLTAGWNTLSPIEYQEQIKMEWKQIEIEWKQTWPERSKKVVDEVHRVLKHGGIFLISNHIKRQPIEIFKKILSCLQTVDLFVGSERYFLIVKKSD